MAVSVRFHREDPWERLRLDERGDAEHAALDDRDRQALHLVAPVRGGRHGARVPLHGAQRPAARPDRRPDERRARPRPDGTAREGRGRRGGRRSASRTRSAPSTPTPSTPSGRGPWARCPDVDRLYLKDPGGLVDVARLRELAPLFLDGFAPRPVELHSHGTIGLAPQMYMEGARLGFGTLHTAVAPVATAPRTRPPRPRSTTSRRPASTTRSTSTPSPPCPRTSARSRSTSACRSARPPSTTPPTTATRCRAAW